MKNKILDNILYRIYVIATLLVIYFIGTPVSACTNVSENENYMDNEQIDKNNNDSHKLQLDNSYTWYMSSTNEDVRRLEEAVTLMQYYLENLKTYHRNKHFIDELMKSRANDISEYMDSVEMEKDLQQYFDYIFEAMKVHDELWKLK